MLHNRCRATEAGLQARVEDLRAEVERLNDRFDALLEKSAARERELLDKVLALTNPGALHALRSTAPAQPMPQAATEPGGRKPARPSLLPGSTRSQPRPDARPLLTPEAARFRPSAAPAPPEQTAEGALAEVLK